MVRPDASKINRIVERFHLATVDTASIKHEIEKARAEKGAGEKRRLPPFPKRDSPKRAMRTSCWTRCWVRPQGRRSLREQAPLRRGRKNPLRSRLPGNRPAKPLRGAAKKRRAASFRPQGTEGYSGAAQAGRSGSFGQRTGAHKETGQSQPA